MKILAKDLNKYYDKEITFEGFVDNIRDLQWVMFIILRDSTGKVQIHSHVSLSCQLRWPSVTFRSSVFLCS